MSPSGTPENKLKLRLHLPQFYFASWRYGICTDHLDEHLMRDIKNEQQ